MFKRNIFLFLVIVLVASCLYVSAETEYSFVDEGDGISITGYAGFASDLMIPDQIEGKKVVSIAKEAFLNNGRISTVALPDGIVRIGSSAFQGAYNLSQVDLPDSLRIIEANAFNSCGNLKSVALPIGLTDIPEGTFFRCIQLEDVVLPNGIRTIGSKAFAVTGISKIQLPDGIEEIGEHSFYGNRYLEEIVLPNSVKNIGEYAFFVCESLKQAVLPASLQSMSAGIFDKCPSMQTIAIPMTVKSIRPDALFSGSLRPQNLAIVSPAGSAAEKFALQAGIAFKPTVSTSNVTIVNENGEEINNQKCAIDLSSDEKELDVKASTSPETMWPGVVWQSSNSQVASVDAFGHIIALKKGEAIITALAADGSGAQSSFTVNVANLAKSIIIEGNEALFAKGKLNLKAIVFPETADNRKVDWQSSDPSVATITNNGQVKAESLKTKKTVHLIATARDGSGVTAMHNLTVYPLTEEIRIISNGQLLENKSNLSIDLAGATKTIQLTVDNYPSDAMQQVKWESSSKRVAQVDENGLICGLKKGKAVITASTLDGTRKKITLNVEVSTLAKDIMITGESNVSAGQKLKLSAVVLPEDATNKKVIWSSSDESIARVNKKSGEVVAEKIAEQQKVLIIAETNDGSGRQAQMEVVVYPSATGVKILHNKEMLENKAKLTVSLSETEQIQLSASVMPSDALQSLKWKSSNERVATVDDTGKVVALRNGKVTITAIAVDGSRVRSIVEINFIK